MNPVIKYALAALLLLGSTFTHADTGKIWTMSDAINGSLHYGTTSNEAFQSFCSAYGNCAGQCGSTTVLSSTLHRYHYNYYTPCSKSGSPSRDANLQTLTCPSTYPYVDENGNCTATEPPPQCEAGNVVVASPQNLNDGSYTMSSNTGDIAGCEYAYQDLYNCQILVDGTFNCNYTLSSTGSPAPAGATEMTENPSPGPQNDSPTDDQQEDTASTNYSKDPTVTNPDGSTTDASTETTTKTNSEGPRMWNDDDYVYYEDSDGNTYVYERQRTTTTFNDGTQQETVSTSHTTDPADKTTTTVNKNTGNTTTSNTTVNSSTTQTVTNNYYDSEGNLTSTDSTTTGGTNGQDDETKEGNCGAPNQPPCDVSLEGSDQLLDPAGSLDSAILPKLDEMIQGLNSVGTGSPDGEFLELNPLNLYEGGSCDPNAFSTDYHGESFRPLEGFCSFYDSDVRPILAFLFYALTAWALYTIYIYTMRKT